MWALRKSMVALPILAILVLARCGSDATDNGGGSAGAEQGGDAATAEAEAEQETSATGDTGTSNAEEYSAGQIKAAMRAHIERRARLGNPGVFEITDPRTSRTLELAFQKIHDPVRTMGDGLYFACTNFAEVGKPDKTYDLDFWLQAHDGELIVYEENVHKLPVRDDGQWVQQPRYNFVDDRINLLR